MLRPLLLALFCCTIVATLQSRSALGKYCLILGYSTEEIEAKHHMPVVGSGKSTDGILVTFFHNTTDVGPPAWILTETDPANDTPCVRYQGIGWEWDEFIGSTVHFLGDGLSGEYGYDQISLAIYPENQWAVFHTNFRGDPSESTTLLHKGDQWKWEVPPTPQEVYSAE